MIIEYSEISDKVESVRGYLSPKEPETLFKLAQQTPVNGTILEIGPYAGKSTSALAFACLGTNRKVYCIDNWKESEKSDGDDLFNEWKTNMESLGLLSCVTPIRDSSYDALVKWNKEIDLIFIDGGHDYHIVVVDFVLSYHWVRVGGIVALHDIHEAFPGVLETWDIVKSLLIDIQSTANLFYGRKHAKNILGFRNR